MANLNKIVYLTEAQKETLFTNGTITVNGQTITYNDNDLYITPTAIDTYPALNSDNLITSGAVATGLGEKANLTSPAFTGVPTAPTAATTANNTQIATTAFVKTAIATAIAENTYNGSSQVVS